MRVFIVSFDSANLALASALSLCVKLSRSVSRTISPQARDARTASFRLSSWRECDVAEETHRRGNRFGTFVPCDGLDGSRGIDRTVRLSLEKVTAVSLEFQSYRGVRVSKAKLGSLQTLVCSCPQKGNLSI
jgi:hypothetical protein